MRFARAAKIRLDWPRVIERTSLIHAKNSYNRAFVKELKRTEWLKRGISDATAHDEDHQAHAQKHHQEG
jgi:hypothetical protein